MMKKIFTFLAVVIMVNAAWAQSDFTATDFPSVGDTGAYSTASYAGYYDNSVETSTGSNYTWDFTTSDYAISPGQGYYGFVAPVAANYGNVFPSTSNLREQSVFADGDNLYEKNNDTLFITLIGAPGGSNYRLNPKFPYLVFPMSFNQTSTAAQTEYVDTAMTHVAFLHSQTVKYDGYGTVKLPWGTFNDVFRLAVTTRDSNLVNGTVITNSKYFWLQKGGASPLVRYSSVAFADSVSHVYSIAMNRTAQGGSSTGIAEVANQPIQLYPNPACEKIQIGNIAKGATVQVFDLMGKLVLSSTTIDDAINIAALANGYYTLVVLDNKTQPIGRGRFVKQ